MESKAKRGYRWPSFVAVTAVGAWFFLAAPTLSATTERSDVWITVGADAFDSLATAPDLRFLGQPLQPFAERAEVVLTRVDGRDLETIANHIHTTHRRCAGFMVHGSLEEALEVLAAAGRVAAPGATAFTIDQEPVVLQLEAALSEASMLASIASLSTDFNNRYYQHPSGVAAAQWIHDLWQTYAQGRSDVSVALFQHAGWPQPSVILSIAGDSTPDEIVVLGGHLDSRAPGSGNPDFLAPGADDNASGIAVLSEIVRVAMAEDFRPQRTVQVMAYAAEEVGLLGSQEIAASYQAAGADVVAVLQLDMTDYNGSVEDIALLSDHVDPILTGFLGDLVDAYQPALLWTSTACGYACSDHASWTSRGYPAAMPFEARMGQHNPWIHTTQDTLGTLGDSVAHAHKFARLGVAFMVEVAKASTTSIFADGFETGTTEHWSVVFP